MKDSITKSEHLQLIGLVTLGRRLQEQEDQIVRAIEGIMGEEDGNQSGHASDMVFANDDAPVLAVQRTLEKVKISMAST